MKQLLLLLALFSCSCLQAKDVFVRGSIADGIRVSSAFPLPENRCGITFRPVGGSAKTKAQAYSNSLEPAYIARFTVAGNVEQVTLWFEAPGYETESRTRPIVKAGDKYIVDVGTIKLIAEPGPKITNVVLSRNASTQALAYRIYLDNPTDEKHTFTELKIRIAVKHNFSSAGLSDNKSDDLHYRIDDVMYVNAVGATAGTVALGNDPNFEVDMNGKIEFRKTQGLIIIELRVEMNLSMVQQGENSILIELPKQIKILANEPLADDPLFVGDKLTTVNFTTSTLKSTYFELKPADENKRSIQFTKQHS
jgi:hypothetical protein